MSFECQFCKKTFPKESNLKRHQTTSQKCLIIQNKEVQEHMCQHCNHSFARKYCLDRHLKTCKSNNTNNNNVDNVINSNTVYNLNIDRYIFEDVNVLQLSFERIYKKIGEDTLTSESMKRTFIVDSQKFKIDDKYEIDEDDHESYEKLLAARIMEICSEELSKTMQLN